MNNRSAVFTLAAASCLAALSAPASAIVLLPTDTSTPVTPDALPLGTLEATETLNIASITPGVFGGTFTSSVYRDPLGTLNFVYQYAATAASTSSVSRITLTGFASPITTDVNYRLDMGGTVAPTTANRRPTLGSLTGDVVGFDFSSPPTGLGNIDPGQTTFAFLIRTNALAYVSEASNVSFIDGSVAITRTFAPAPVPEPTSLAILAIGGIGVFVRRRKKA